MRRQRRRCGRWLFAERVKMQQLSLSPMCWTNLMNRGASYHRSSEVQAAVENRTIFFSHCLAFTYIFFYFSIFLPLTYHLVMDTGLIFLIITSEFTKVFSSSFLLPPQRSIYLTPPCRYDYTIIFRGKKWFQSRHYHLSKSRLGKVYGKGDESESRAVLKCKRKEMRHLAK